MALEGALLLSPTYPHRELTGVVVDEEGRPALPANPAGTVWTPTPWKTPDCFILVRDPKIFCQISPWSLPPNEKQQAKTSDPLKQWLRRENSAFGEPPTAMHRQSYGKYAPCGCLAPCDNDVAGDLQPCFNCQQQICPECRLTPSVGPQYSLCKWCRPPPHEQPFIYTPEGENLAK